MLKLICFLAALAVASSDYYYLKPKVFHFERYQNNYSFEYTLDNGEIFSGKAVPLHMDITNVYMLLGANESVYWVRFSQEDLEKVSFDKFVNHLQVDKENDVLAELNDDIVCYTIDKNGKLNGGEYRTEWDFDNVLFQPTGTAEKTFNYVIFSKNNGRQQKGITSYDKTLYVQNIIASNDFLTCNLFEVHFTDDELNSGETIYKQIMEACPPDLGSAAAPPLAAGVETEISPSLLKAMVG